MCARSGSRRRRGVSLSEALVSLLILTMVMIVALTLLFTMKSFAERQQVKTAPRQTARRAIDYVGALVAGATDLNDLNVPPSPNAIVTFYSRPGAGGPAIKQASYNNLPDGSAFGEPGTDILTIALPVSGEKIPFTQWSGTAHTEDWLDYRTGCNGATGTTEMTSAFLGVTGAHGTAGAERSGLLTAFGSDGRWAYYQITNYQQGTWSCGSLSGTGDANSIRVIADPLATDRINPPGGEPTLTPPVFLCPGMRFFSFRVRRDGNGVLNLEQKAGLFDPDTDNPGAAFTPIMPDVEDFQVAYLYSRSPDGTGRTVFNTWDEATSKAVPIASDAGQPTGSGGVPYQGTGSLWDVENVAGLRVSITARSAPLRFESRQISVRRGGRTVTNARPRSEDHVEALPDEADTGGAAGAVIGDFDHHRITSTLLLRNRMLGN